MSNSDSELSFPNPFLSSSSFDDNELFAAFNEWQLACQRHDEARAESSKRRRRRRTHIERGREQGEAQLRRDYFSEVSTYTDAIFRRRFRMRKHVFMRIVESLENGVEYFQQRPDATGRLGIFALQKCTSAIRMLAYGTAADASDEYLRLAEGTARKSLEYFVDGVISIFGDEYLRQPTVEDLQRLLVKGEARGFPGMLGSIDCMHWAWKNCPNAWKSQYARGDHGYPTIVLEAVASHDLWFWHTFFGVPGTCNDINVLDRSPVFDDVLHGRAPYINFMVNGHQYNKGYYLTDGIYPPWATFVQSVRHPQSPKAKLFAQVQEGARKDVERAFGVLQSRFAIIRNPALSWDLIKIGKIMRACIILHNMIVEDERDEYEGDLPEYDQEGVAGSVNPSDYTTARPINMRDYLQNTIQVRDKTTHQQLQNDLMENIWQKFGN